jgi:hypothetical protein
VTAPQRVAFSFTEATAEREPAPNLPPAKSSYERVPGGQPYPVGPMVYPGRPVFCSGCANHSAWLMRNSVDGLSTGGFRERAPLPGERNCETCKGREKERDARMAQESAMSRAGQR